MNTPVNFELAKLLKEKGFNKPVNSFYTDAGKLWKQRKQIPTANYNAYPKNPNSKLFYKYGYSAPTIADVIMWLYEKHGVWVRVTPIPYSDNLTHWRREHMSTNYSTRNFKWKKEQDYMSPTEAYEAAIEYTLTKLI